MWSPDAALLHVIKGCHETKHRQDVTGNVHSAHKQRLFLFFQNTILQCVCVCHSLHSTQVVSHICTHLLWSESECDCSPHSLGLVSVSLDSSKPQCICFYLPSAQTFMQNTTTSTLLTVYVDRIFALYFFWCYYVQYSAPPQLFHVPSMSRVHIQRKKTISHHLLQLVSGSVPCCASCIT